MAKRKPAKTKVFTEEERAAIAERAKEAQAARRSGKGADKADEEAAVLQKIAEMSAADRALAQRLHGAIKANAPVLSPKLWYGMPAYARDGKIVCFFQPAQKFKTRYATLGFNDSAHLDEGELWPVAFALRKMGPTEEAKVVALVKKAAG